MGEAEGSRSSASTSWRTRGSATASWTFRGTRIMVWIVLDQVAREMPWDTIVKEWGGSVPREAIAEAIELARGNLVATNEKWRRKALTRLAATG